MLSQLTKQLVKYQNLVDRSQEQEIMTQWVHRCFFIFLHSRKNVPTDLETRKVEIYNKIHMPLKSLYIMYFYLKIDYLILKQTTSLPL